MFHSVICFLTGHRWSTASICEFCGQACGHSVVVNDLSLHTTRCLDCRVLMAFPDMTREPGLTLRRRVQQWILRAGGWDAGPNA